jgi:hypothetical protein
LTCPDGDNQWFWGGHLAHVSHAESSSLGVTEISCYLLNLEAKILSDDIHRANPFQAHPCHYLLTCSDGDNQWFWGGHLAHVSHAESDLSLGGNKISCYLLNFGAKILPDDIHRANPFHAHPCSSMPSSLDMSGLR